MVNPGGKRKGRGLGWAEAIRNEPMRMQFKMQNPSKIDAISVKRWEHFHESLLVRLREV